MSDSQNLGPVGIWQIKNFPDGLRKAIVERAALEKITVGELLIRVMVAVIDADWRVGDAVNPSATQSTPPASLEVIERAIAAAAVLASTKGVPQDFRRLVNERLRDMLMAPKVGEVDQPKQLAAPE